MYIVTGLEFRAALRPCGAPRALPLDSEASLAIPYHTGFALPWAHQESGSALNQLCPRGIYPACTQALGGVSTQG
ncbi:hypothetical protein JCGZ_13203 [Jatropha curcas]|uniref:Uncharacterized protein n=1 Tax=Jatropha curcas TaxID=180498 RepID=A0A067KBB5_JATCU|nr:hypothetical protein JCGZ_13203 [Jatropha curcas]